MSVENKIIDYNDEQKHHILIVDDSVVILKMIVHILEEHNYKITTAKDGAEALELLKKEKMDFIITDINMPHIGGFVLVEKLQELELDIPYIMITDVDINQYLELAIKNDVGNILSKPIEKTELLNTVYKLLYPETLFGLKNYLLTEEPSLKTLDVKSTQQCEESVLKIVTYAEKVGLDKDLLDSLRLILNEMTINALYHPHGLTDKKEQHEAVQLREGDKIQLQYAYDDLKFGVSITDFAGNLTKLQVLQTFKEFIDSNEQMLQALESGDDPTQFMKDTGRGLQLTREMANEYYFNIKLNQLTQIVILTWLEKCPVTHKSHSIKINEVQ